LPHPDEVVETLSLSSVSSPDIGYVMAIPDELVRIENNIFSFNPSIFRLIQENFLIFN
jgi:hypothetical protein